MKPVIRQISGNVPDQSLEHLLNNISIKVWRLAIDRVRTRTLIRALKDDIMDNIWLKMR